MNCKTDYTRNVKYFFVNGEEINKVCYMHLNSIYATSCITRQYKSNKSLQNIVNILPQVVQPEFVDVLGLHRQLFLYQMLGYETVPHSQYLIQRQREKMVAFAKNWAVLIQIQMKSLCWMEVVQCFQSLLWGYVLQGPVNNFQYI